MVLQNGVTWTFMEILWNFNLIQNLQQFIEMLVQLTFYIVCKGLGRLKTIIPTNVLCIKTSFQLKFLKLHEFGKYFQHSSVLGISSQKSPRFGYKFPKLPSFE